MTARGKLRILPTTPFEGAPSRSSGVPLPPFILVLLMAAVLLLAAGCTGGTTSTTSSGGGATTGSAQPAAGTDPDIQQDLFSPAEAVVSAVYVSVVNVKVTGVVGSPLFGNQPYEGIGSGIIYSSDGFILTNNHVVSQNGVPAQSVEVTFGSGETAKASIVARDEAGDLAAIKVDKTGLTPVSFGKSSDVKIGAWIIAIGSPLDYQNSVSLGIVSGLNRQLATGGPNSPTLTGLLQTDAAISPGNSGGGLFDAQGHLIGMPEAYLPPGQTGAQNIGFAIPVDTVVKAGKALTGK